MPPHRLQQRAGGTCARTKRLGSFPTPLYEGWRVGLKWFPGTHVAVAAAGTVESGAKKRQGEKVRQHRPVWQTASSMGMRDFALTLVRHQPRVRLQSFTKAD